LPFDKDTFDAVISIGTFKMIGEERNQALAEMIRVARPGAYIGIAEPMSLFEDLPYDIDDNLMMHGFKEFFRTLDWNSKLFEEQGLNPPIIFIQLATKGQEKVFKQLNLTLCFPVHRFLQVHGFFQESVDFLALDFDVKHVKPLLLLIFWFVQQALSKIVSFIKAVLCRCTSIHICLIILGQGKYTIDR